MSRVLNLVGVPIVVLSGAVAHAQPQMQLIGKWIVSTGISGMACDAQGNVIASDGPTTEFWSSQGTDS